MRVAQPNAPMKYWEIVADKLSAAGWSWDYCSAVTRDGWRWIVDAHREGRRYIVHSDELLSAFLELGTSPKYFNVLLISQRVETWDYSI
jgi:hypothetical protein